MLMDISDFEGLNSIKEKYLEMNKDLEYVPKKDGVYAVFRIWQMQLEFFLWDMFEETWPGRFRPHGQEIWIFVIRSVRRNPAIIFGFKDT